jgi:hypothetical protein
MWSYGIPNPPSGRATSALESPQEPVKAIIELVAEAPAALRHDLLQETLFLEDDGNAEMDVEILEGDRAEVREMQLAQDTERWRFRKVGSDPIQVIARASHSRRHHSRPGFWVQLSVRR